MPESFTLAKLESILIDQGVLDAGAALEEGIELSDIPLDSLDHVECIMAIEEDTGCDIPDEIAEQWNTAGEVVEGVNTILAAQ